MTETRKDRAAAWFAELCDRICSAFEALEEAYAGETAARFGDAPGRFERRAWQREAEGAEEAGGGVMAIMKGRLFEKVGVNISTVWGEFSPEFAKNIPGAEDDPRFWPAASRWSPTCARPWSRPST